MATGSVDISVISARRSAPLMEGAQRGVAAEEKRLMQAIVARLHGRHIGVTPELALSLARLLTAPPVRSVLSKRAVFATGGGADEAAEDKARQAGSLPWSLAIERMSLVHDPTGQSRLMPHLAPWWVVTRLAAPILWQACEAIGQTVLFGSDGLGEDMAGDYADYATRLKRAVTVLIEAETDEGMPELFWRDLAHSLAGLMKRERMARGGSDGGLPQVDPSNLALMLRLPLRESRRRLSRKVTVRRASDAAHRAGRHPQMMGVTGIRVASGVDEIDRMLASEYLNPPMILADRLMNTGFLATDRPPPQQHRRDMMVIGLSLLPASGSATPLARTAYVEAMRRLVPVMVQARQRDSRTVWMELGRLGGLDAQSFSFEKVVAMASRAGRMRNSDDAPPRGSFIAGLGLLPEFLDAHEVFPNRVLPPEALAVDPEKGELTTAENAGQGGAAVPLSALRGAERWAELALDQIETLAGLAPGESNPASYANLHLLAFVQAPENAEDAALAGLHRRLEALIRKTGMSGRACSLVVLPHDGELTVMRRVRGLFLPAGSAALNTPAHAGPEGRAASWANAVAEFAAARIEEGFK